MKKIVCFSLLLTFITVLSARGQVQELRQLALNVEKLAQFRTLLRDMKKGYDLLEGGYNGVRDLTQGNFQLHKTFLDALLQVSPTVRDYYKVGEVIHYQIKIISACGSSLNQLNSSELLHQEELYYVDGVYARVVDESLQNIEELTTILTAGRLRMSDEERLAAIDRIHAAMQDKVLFVENFSQDALLLVLQRAREYNDVNAMRLLLQSNP